MGDVTFVTKFMDGNCVLVYLNDMNPTYLHMIQVHIIYILLYVYKYQNIMISVHITTQDDIKKLEPETTRRILNIAHRIR